MAKYKMKGSLNRLKKDELIEKYIAYYADTDVKLKEYKKEIESLKKKSLGYLDQIEVVKGELRNCSGKFLALDKSVSNKNVIIELYEERLDYYRKPWYKKLFN